MNFFIDNIRFLVSGIPRLIEFDRLEQFTNGIFPSPDELLELSAKTGYTIDRLLGEDIARRAVVPSNLKLVIFDVDGVMTDGGMYYSESGDEFKKFNAKDGLAIKALKHAGFETGIISHGINSGLIGRRAALLNIAHVYTGAKPKEEVLLEWCVKLGITRDQVAYIGDDVNDLSVMEHAGFTACPQDAVERVRNAVDVVLRKKGGEGCIREWVDAYLLADQKNK
jgi:3-deoxy-D-manno-octulosonate 8-phosphate phosphatase (KDO 8-P phosphatase)